MLPKVASKTIAVRAKPLLQPAFVHTLWSHSVTIHL